MRTNQVLSFVVMSALSAACGGSSSNAPVAAEPPATESAASAKQVSSAGDYVEAANSLALTPDQRLKLQSIAAELARKTDPLRQSKLQVAQIVAAGIPSGKMDREQLTPALDRLEQAAANAKPAVAEAVNGIHGILTPEQRVQFASAYKAELAEVRGALAEDLEARRNQLRQLGRALDLTEAQKSTIQAKVQQRIQENAPKLNAKVQDMIDRRAAAADAFPSPNFDANQYVNEQSDVRTMLEQRIQFFEQILGDLTPEQRSKLSAIVRMGGEL
jgi:Spy/CpxP family protein refolding chaperone